MQTYVINIGLAVILSTLLGKYLWAPQKSLQSQVPAVIAKEVNVPQADEEILGLVAVMERLQETQQDLSSQLTSVVQGMSGVRNDLRDEMSVVIEAVKALDGEMAILGSTLGEYGEKLVELENAVDSGHSHAVPGVGGLADTNLAQIVGESSPQKSFENTSLKFESEVRDQSWAMNTESEINTSFANGSTKVDLADISCKASSCRVAWSYRNIEGLSPEELLFVEHELHKALAEKGLKTAIYDQSVVGQNIAIFIKEGDVDLPLGARRR